MYVYAYVDIDVNYKLHNLAIFCIKSSLHRL